MQKDMYQEFIKNNSHFIYEYINEEILKDIAIMNESYFIKTIEDISIEKIDIDNINKFPYYLLTQVFNKGKIDYTSLRAETIDFKQINKEALTYYNYALFTIKEKTLLLELMQSKYGGMAVDEDVVKFSKSIAIDNSGLEQFIINKKKEIKK